mgnify:FL=1
MNKSVFNFGEGTGSSPNKFGMGGLGGYNSEQLRMMADANDRMRKPFLDAVKKARGEEPDVVEKGGGSDEKLNAINKIINS